MGGNSDVDISDLSIDIDLDISALGIFKTSVKENAGFSISPSVFVSGATIIVGPFTLPSAPGSVVLKGTLKIVNPKAEPVTCINFDMDLPAMSEAAAALEEKAGADLCTTPQDHLKNFISTTSGDTTTTTFTVDKNLVKATVGVDITIQESFLRIPIKMDVPVSFTPGLAKNDYTIVTTTSGAQLSQLSSELGVTAKGQVKIDDENGEQITCIAVDSQTAEATKTII